ncbi:MAG: insulinase family protein [Desulfobacterales bacterium]|nr:insulinase family protein [Desulfobacterales bacterium]
MINRCLRSTIFILVTTLFLTSLFLSSCTTTGQYASPTWPHEKSDLEPDPAVIYGRFHNGFRYILMPNQTPPGRVSMHLNVQAGSIYELDDQRGIAHFLEHMLFNGSTNFAPGDLVKFFQSIGMDFGADVNAHTGFIETVYDVILPDGTDESFKKGFTVLGDYAEGALLLETEIEKEREVILSEKRDRDSESYRSYVEALKFELPDSIFSKRIIIGTEDVVKNADRSVFKDFYDTWYRPEKMVLVITGDFEADHVIPMVESRFADIQARAPARPEPVFGDIDHKGIKSFYRYEPDAGSTNITIEVATKNSPVEDTAARRKEMFVRHIADQVVQNRLETMVSKPGTPFTDAIIGSGHYLNFVDYAEIAAEGDPEKWEDILASIEQVLRTALTYGFTQSELDRVKKDTLAQLETAVEKAPTRKSQTLARRLMRSLNYNKVFSSPGQELALFAPVLAELTIEDVHQAFQETWSPDHRLILLTGNLQLDETDEDATGQILAAYNSSLAVAVSKPLEAKAVSFPYLPVPDASGEIIKQETIEDLGITQIDFKNGVRLNLKKTDFKVDEILINITFGNGRSDEPVDKPGLGTLSSAVINESGLGALTKNELDRALAGKKTGTWFDVDGSHFLLSGVTIPEETPLLFELLYARIMDPAFREDAYLLSLERLNQEYKSQIGTVEGMMTLEGRRFLASGDTRFGFPSYEQLSALSIEDIKAWIEPPLKTAPLEVTVVGDFDTDTIIENVAKYLGTLPDRKQTVARQRTDLPKLPAGEKEILTAKTGMEKALVIVAYPTEDIWDIRRTRRLNTLASVLSERLRLRIREEMGVAYSVFAFNRGSRTYKDFGSLKAYVPLSPDQIDLVVSEIKKIVADLAKGDIPEDELERAKAPVLTGIRDMIKTNDYWLDTVVTGSVRHPRQIEWSRSILDDYAAITAKEVSDLAKKYLDNDKAAILIIKPE